METPLEIGQLAKLIGRHPQTVRRWEREGFLPPPCRIRGRRVYSSEHVEQILQIVFDEPSEVEDAGR